MVKDTRRVLYTLRYGKNIEPIKNSTFTIAKVSAKVTIPPENTINNTISIKGNIANNP